ncbi:unnamed protein product, partial [Darwinula stevensoni]
MAVGGNYTVSLKVFNDVQGWIASPFYDIYIDPYIPISNLKIVSPTADSQFATGAEIEVSIMMDSGSPALVYIFWDDGSATILERTIDMVNPSQIYKFNHSYASIGMKNVSVEVRNTQGTLIGVANFQTTSVEIEILDPVENNWNLTVSSGLTSGVVLVPPGNVMFELTCSSSTLPAKATATWNFGDGNQLNQVVNSTALEMTKSFQTAGSGSRNATYHVMVNVSNPISSKEVSVDIEVWEAIQNATLAIKYVATDGSLQPGYGANGYSFPLRELTSFIPSVERGESHDA